MQLQFLSTPSHVSFAPQVESPSQRQLLPPALQFGFAAVGHTSPLGTQVDPQQQSLTVAEGVQTSPVPQVVDMSPQRQPLVVQSGVMPVHASPLETGGEGAHSQSPLPLQTSNAPQVDEPHRHAPALHV